MPTEAERHHLLTTLEGVIGREATMTLADHLPPVGWADVATKDDLAHVEVALRSDLANVETTLRSDMATLRSDMATLRSDMANVETTLEARTERRLSDLQRNLFFAILGAFSANTGIVVAVLHASGNG